MTMSMPVTVRCAICGELSTQMALASTSSFGSPDLDLRPQGPARWALQFRVQRCPACGYCAPRIGECDSTSAEAVSSVVYRDVLERARMPRLARHLFCAALVAEAAERREQAAWHFAEAAWACDDAGAAEQARTCRQRAAEMFSAALAWGDVSAESAVVHGVRADLLRRAGRFDEALAALDAAEATLDLEEDSGSSSAVVLGYLLELVEAADDAAHNVAEAFSTRD
jgi:tetratricopeptide (TPR) repeat protein